MAICLLLGLIILDEYRFLFDPHLSPQEKSLIGQKTILEGTVTGPPARQEWGARVEVGNLKTSEQVSLTGGMILNLPFSPSWKRGDRIRFGTRIHRPRHYKNPGSFDYQRFLERRGIHYQGFVADESFVLRISTKESIFSGIDRVRRKAFHVLVTHMSPDAAALMSALLLGEQSGVPGEIWNDFQRTGTVHLLSISGQHIAIVGLCFYSLILWILKRSQRLMLTLSVRKWARLVTIGPILFYILLAGSPPPAVRAAIMASLVVLALSTDRDFDPISALAAAAIGITVVDLAAPFSLSFQLSFLAVLGIILFNPVPSEGGDNEVSWQYRLWRNYILSPLQMGMGAILMTAPVLLYRIHQFSFTGLITNLWAIPAVGFLMIFSGLSLLLSSLLPFLSPLLSLSGFFADWFLKILHVASQFSWTASFYPTEFEFILLELMVGFFLWLRFRPAEWRRVLVSTAIFLCLGFSLAYQSRPKGLEVTFLDVGQGDAAIIRTPTGKSLLIDGGGFLIPGSNRPRFDIGKNVVVPYLKRLGLKKVDRILLSHPHPDHYGGLQEVVQSLPVGEFWWNGQTFPDESFDSLRTALRDRRVTEKILREGESWDWEGLKFDVYYPDQIDPSKNINDNSLVVRISYGEASLLFPGDIEGEGEESLSQGREIHATILKIPHHGSKTSSSVPFIDSVSPAYAIASMGEENSFGFPHPGVLEKYERRGVKVFRTDQEGAITLTVPPTFPKQPVSIRTTSCRE